MPACCRRRGEVQDHLHLHQFSARRRRRACRFSHHFDSFCVVIFSLRMYAQQVFSALFTGVFNTIACVCRRGVSGGFSSWSTVGVCFQCEGFVGRWKCLPIFYRGLMCMCCVWCVYAHTHTLHVGYSDVSPGVGTRHLESPEEIQIVL